MLDLFDLTPEPLTDAVYAYCVGVLAGVIVALLMFLMLAWIVKRRRRRQFIRIEGTTGDTLVGRRAIRDFVGNSLAEFTQVRVKNVEFRPWRNGYRIVVDVSLMPDASLAEDKNAMREVIIRDLQATAGIDAELIIDIRVLRYSG
jgi:hypothetical protein